MSREDHKTIIDKYSLRKELGKGAFSVVRLAVNRSTKERVAIKIIDKKNVSKTQEKNIRSEILILNKVSHPNIIGFKEILENDKYLYFVMEYVNGGELFDEIVTRGSYDEADARDIIRQICSALAYLHSEGIAHRDLKPENLLVSNSEDDSAQVLVKIADFGLSKIIDEEKMMQTACGTPGYVAPEVLLAEGYGIEVDMWSVGVITYIILCGFPPFYSDNVAEVFEQILKADFQYPADYWEDISAEAKDFINSLLKIEPKRRLTAEIALKHPWVREGGEEKGSALNIQKELKKQIDQRRLQQIQTV